MQPAIILAAVLCVVNIVQGRFVPPPNGGGIGFPRPQPYPGPYDPFPKPGPWSPGPTFPRPDGPIYMRARRQADHGSIDLGVRQPLGGPGNRDPSIDLNYNHHIIQNDRERLDAYGGGTFEHGRVSPHAGFQYERNFGNGFIGGYGQAQPRPGGGIDPAFGVRGGFRF